MYSQTSYYIKLYPLCISASLVLEKWQLNYSKQRHKIEKEF